MSQLRKFSVYKLVVRQFRCPTPATIRGIRSKERKEFPIYIRTNHSETILVLRCYNLRIYRRVYSRSGKYDSPIPRYAPPSKLKAMVRITDLLHST